MNIESILSQLTLEEKASLCSGRDFWHTKAIERLNIPTVMMCDGPHGLRKQEGEGDHLGIRQSIETVCYPTASALAASFDRDLLHTLGQTLGQECRAENIGMLLGPGLNIKRSPLCGRNFEYFSEDPYLSGELGAAYVQGLQSQGVAACLKHFACNNQETMRMTSDSLVDERTLHEIYLPAFEAVVKKGGAKSVMCAYNAVNGSFCAENEVLLTQILRQRWGFDGFVVTDWGAVKDRAKGIAAGLDLEMPGRPDALGQEILDAIRDGALSEAALDQAVERLLHFVDFAMRRETAAIDREKCRNLSRYMAGECAVLLKNDGILPLDRRTRVAFIGEFAEKARYQGSGSSHIHVKHVVGALEAVDIPVVYAQGYNSRSPQDDELLSEAVAVAADADVAVVFAGLPDAYETEGCDRKHLHLPENQNKLIQAVTQANANTVVILHGGAVMELPWLEQVSAVLLMHLSGEQIGAATVDLLFGRQNPSGHLAETWPLRLEDNPSYLNFPGEDGVVTYAEGIYVGYRYYDKKKMPVQFPFGYGLSYTQFRCDNLRVDRDQITDRDTVQVHCDVKNVGTCTGKAVLQLYVRDVDSTVRRPERELKGFEKVEIQPGETKTVSFLLDKRSFAYYEPKCHDWYVESGEYEIGVGLNSRDIACARTIWVDGTVLLPFKVTDTTTMGQLLRHPKGKLFAQNILGPSAMSDTQSMGEGSESMMRNMALEMPLGALVSYGRITAQQLKGLLQTLNE